MTTDPISHARETNLVSPHPPTFPNRSHRQISSLNPSPLLSNSATMPLNDSIPRAPTYFRRAARAASYPLRGIGHFVRTKEFWPLFLSRLLPLSVISLIVYFILFVFAFLPQYAFLAIFHGRGAWVNAVVLVLGEGLVIIQGLFEGFFVDECRVDVYDVSIVNWKWKCTRKLTAARRQHSFKKASSISSHHTASFSTMPRTPSRCWASPRRLRFTSHGASSK